jgi:lantibiotic modifying enzyme
MSHGAAGIGLALAELAAAVKEPRFEQAARAAFAYERRWFDSEAGNWPDFRRTWKRGPAKKAAFACTWCHGAPGIALSRLRAWELSGDAQCEAEARLALQTTKRSVQLLLAVPRANYSLCHGIAGNCEVLLQGARVLGASTADDRRLVETAANLGIERYMAGGASSWPWDEGNGGGPGLMTGTAGIGRFYLRLAHAELPSVLLPRAEDWVL